MWAGTSCAVDPRHSSQQCPRCDVVDKKSRPTQALFVCVACGCADADVNAAQNILARGIGRAGATPVPVCGGFAKGGRDAPLSSSL